MSLRSVDLSPASWMAVAWSLSLSTYHELYNLDSYIINHIENMKISWKHALNQFSFSTKSLSFKLSLRLQRERERERE